MMTAQADIAIIPKTTIDATPSSGETTPNYTGTISDHAVVKVILNLVNIITFFILDTIP